MMVISTAVKHFICKKAEPKTLPVSFIVDVRKTTVYRNLIFELKTFNLNN
jgi:hypothetical protein